jgi:hypothetical protein
MKYKQSFNLLENKNNKINKTIIVESCSNGKKLQCQIMPQYHVHSSFHVLSTVAGMKRSGNIARHNTQAGIQN